MDDTQQQVQEQTVEMNIPVDTQTGLPTESITTTTSESTAQPTEMSTVTSETPTPTETNPQPEVVPEQPQNVELSPSSPQTEQPIASDNLTPIKSPPVPGAGAKCQYCEHKEKYQSLFEDYYKRCHAKTGDKVAIPFVQEIADILEKDSLTLNRWFNKKIKDDTGKETEEYEHPEFRELYMRMKNLQELRLLQRTLGRFNPTGAIFQLKTNHGYIETEKKVISGDSNEPLMIEIINEKKEVLAESE